MADLEADDRVKIAREDGTTAVFGVTRVKQFPKESFPTARVYGDRDIKRWIARSAARLTSTASSRLARVIAAR